MDPFRTVLAPLDAPFQIDHKQRILLLGSCFTEHIGQALAERKFPCLSNPFGIVYNPLSMAQSLERLLEGNQVFEAKDLFQHDGLWHSWHHHGRFSKPDREQALSGINEAYRSAATFLSMTDTLVLTFGTAHVFALKASGQLVANNHKMPAHNFEPKRLSVAEIVDQTIVPLKKLRKRLPNLQIVLTVSPVRHLRDGLIENQRSKARLLLACDEICRQMDQVHYFPAYELLQDDLRDYRFYAADMVHPSPVAINYVWQFFCQTYFAKATQGLNERIEKIRAAAAHRPFHSGTAQHQAFLHAQLEAVQNLANEAPHLDFDPELVAFRAQLLG